MLTIFAKITPKTEFYADARRAVLDIIESTKQEHGCIQFNLLSEDDSSAFYLYEEWESPEALDKHYTMPYTLDVFENYKQWLEKPVEVLRLNKVDDVCSS